MSIKVCIVCNTCVDDSALVDFSFGNKEFFRIDSIKNAKRKRESLAALVALTEITEDIADRCIERDDFGRPHFKNHREIDFSISHSVALSLAARIDGNGIKIGADIELIKENDRNHLARIADKFFTEKEKALLNGMQNSDYFYMVWTAKEAISKKIGRGLSAMLSDTCPLSENNGVLSHFLVEHEGSRYMLTLCSDTREDIEFLCDASIRVTAQPIEK